MINLSINNVDIKARHINSDLFYCVGLTAHSCGPSQLQ